MAKTVVVNGVKHQFPDELPDSEIESILAKEYKGEREPEPTTFNDDISKFLEGAGELPGKIQSNFMDQEYTSMAIPGDPSTSNPVTMGANIARPALESIADVAGVGVDAWMATYGQIPGVKKLLKEVGDSDTMRMIAELAYRGGEWWDAVKEDYPLEAKLAEDAGIVAEVVTSRLPLPVDKLAKKGARIRREGTQQKIDQREEAIQDMLLPETKVGEGTTREIQEGITPLSRRTVYDPIDKEDTIIKTYSTVEGIDPNRSFAYNLGVTDEAIRGAQAETEKILRSQHRNRIDTADLEEQIEASLNDITEIPGYHALRGDAEVIARDYLIEAQRILRNAKKTPMGLLEARREFDRIVNQGGDVFGSPSQTAKQVAARYIRDQMNEHLLRSIGAKEGDAVYDLLQRQHNLLLGTDMLKTKAKTQATDAIGRIAQAAKKSSLIPSGILSLLATGSYAMGSPVLAGTMAGAAATTVAVPYIRGGLKGPQIKRVLGSLIQSTEKLNDIPAADRVVLVELLKLSNEELEAMFADEQQPSPVPAETQ